MSGFKIFWLSLCFCFAAVFFFSETLVSIQPEHECHGPDCPVCLLIQRAEDFSRLLKNALVFAGFPAVMVLTGVFILKASPFPVIPMSAVRLKVKINR